MPSFNRVTLLGNLTRDPQLKHLVNNTTIADFGLAMSRRYKTHAGQDREEVCFIDCAAFGKQAKVIAPVLQERPAALHRGALEVRSVGRQDQWHTAEQDLRRRRKLPIPRRARR